MQRLLMGEVGAGKTVVALARDAARGRERRPGRAHGAHRDARRAAPPHARLAARRRTCRWSCSPAPRPPRAGASCSTGSRAAQLQLVVGTHALIEDAGGVPRPRGGRGGRAAPLRRAPARRARRQGARRARAARAPHDRHADPAHAVAHRLRRPRRHRAARAARAGAGRWRRYVVDGARARRARTSGSARRSPPGASASSSARWSRSRRRCRPRRPPPSSSGCAPPSSRDQRVELIHGQMPSKQKAGRDGGVRRRRGRRARGHERDRGRHRRAERDRDADRGGRALRPLAAAPAARAGRPRRARVALHPVRRPGAAAARGDRRTSATASGSPRSTSSCAAPARCSARASTGCPSSGWRGCPRTTELLVRARDRADELLRRGPATSSSPEHALLREAVVGALRLGARPDPGVRVVAGEFKGRRLRAPRGQPHAADRRPRARGALLDARRRVGRARARPLRGLRRARDRGALARRRVGGVRGARPRGARGDPAQPRGARRAGRTCRRQDALRFLAASEGTFDLVFCRPAI